MDEISIANKRLKGAQEKHDQDYEESIRAQDQWESELTECLDELNCKKHDIAKANGNLDLPTMTSLKSMLGGES